VALVINPPSMQSLARAIRTADRARDLLKVDPTDYKRRLEARALLSDVARDIERATELLAQREG